MTLTTVYVLAAAPGRFVAATVLAVVMAVLIGGLSYKTASFYTAGGRVYDDLSWLWYLVGAPATAWILTAFGLTAIEERGARWPYGRFFNHLFGFPVQLVFAAAVVGLLNLAIWAWSELFEIIGITVISELWEEPLIWFPMSGAFAALGVALARQWTAITSVLRTLCRYVARFALPIFAAFTVTLLIALPVQGLQDLFGSRSAAGVMSALAAFSIFLVYGARQDLVDRPPAWLRISTALVVLGVPVYTALAVWAIWLRVGQYGFTPERYVGLVLVLILFLQAAGLLAVQALDTLRRKGWLAGAGVVNMAVLALLAAFLMAQHTPQLEPHRISADSQYLRLADERVDAGNFDYGYLRFKLGEAGEQTLERLDKLDGHPQIGTIRAGIARARQARNYWEYQSLTREEQQEKPPESAPDK